MVLNLNSVKSPRTLCIAVWMGLRSNLSEPRAKRLPKGSMIANAFLAFSYCETSFSRRFLRSSDGWKKAVSFPSTMTFWVRVSDIAVGKTFLRPSFMGCVLESSLLFFKCVKGTPLVFANLLIFLTTSKKAFYMLFYSYFEILWSLNATS